MGKVLGLVVGGLVALLALLLVSVWLFIKPNTYKPRIAAVVREATGRELVLTGDIHLSLFPWIALQLGPASLGNPPGFGGQPFASFKQATFRARLLPLLARRLEIGRVEIDGLDARLVRKADGRGNWEGTETVAGTAAGMGAEGGVGAAGGAGTEGVVGTEGGVGTARGAGAASAGASGGAGIAGRVGTQGGTEAGGAAAAGNGHGFAGIAGVKITNSRVSYGQYRVENINLEAGAFAEHEVVPVALTFDVDRGVATENSAVQARFDLSADLTAKRYRVVALTIRSTVNLADAARPVRWSLSAPALDVDVGGQTLNATEFELDLAGTHLSGRVAGRGTLTLKATGRGVGGAALLRSLNGRVDAVVTGGALEGVDVGFQLGRAEALLRGQSGVGVQDSHRTPFDVMKVSADIADGVARTRDLTIASSVLKVTGQGSVDLAAQTLDLTLLADTPRTAGGTPIQIPLAVTGALAEPSVRPDLEALSKGELRHRVQDLLQDKLKGLLNR